MGATVLMSYAWLERVVPGAGAAAQALRLGGAVGVGVLVYGLLVWAMRVPEMILATRLAAATIGKIGEKLWHRSAPGRASENPSGGR